MREDRQDMQERRLLPLIRNRHRRVGKTSYFAEDCRSVTEVGVAHVMRVFMRHYVRNFGALRALKELVGGLTPRAAPQPSEVEQMAQVVRVMCEEEARWT
jgi:hypothetical protein